MTDSGAPQLPRAVAIAWGVAELPQRGPKRELSTERIVDAAMEIADADGLDAVSMGRVATALGFTPMSLYRYVTGKDDLLLLMFDAACDAAIPPALGDWREQVRSWATHVRVCYQAHPWLTAMPPSSTPTTPNRLAIMDAALRAMRETGLPDTAKVAIALLLLGYIGLFGESGHEAEVDGAMRAALPELVTPERFPYLADAVREGVFAEPIAGADRAFHFGLSRLIDGIQAWIERAELSEPHAERVPEGVANDRKVRDALKAVREAEARLQAAERTARTAVERAVQREEHVAERVQQRQAKADAKADAKAARRRE